MKKLIIAAMLASTCSIGYSLSTRSCSACSEPRDVEVCRAWEVQMTLKTLAPEKTKCGKECTPCGEEPSTVYYLDSKTRKIKGYLWICDYSCEDEPQFNCVLWDPDKKVAVIAYSSNVQTVSASEVYAYGKKATKVAGTINFAGVDALGEAGIDVVASGVNGKMERPKNGDCYIKSLGGSVCGTIKYVKPGTITTVVEGRGGLCSEPVVTTCSDEYLAKLVPFCSACCFDGWCTADDAPDMVPCVGTWKIKYNKKVSNGGKSIRELIPDYAL